MFSFCRNRGLHRTGRVSGRHTRHTRSTESTRVSNFIDEKLWQDRPLFPGKVFRSGGAPIPWIGRTCTADRNCVTASCNMFLCHSFFRKLLFSFLKGYDCLVARRLGSGAMNTSLMSAALHHSGLRIPSPRRN